MLVTPGLWVQILEGTHTVCDTVNVASSASSNPRADKVQICRSAPEQAVNPLFLGRH
jgi:hypothetical protein